MTENAEVHVDGPSFLTEDQMILARSKLWTPELDKLLRRWKKQLGKRENGHLDLARKYSRRHYFFGVPATVLSALIATGILATFRNCDACEDQSSPKCSVDQWIRLVIGIVSLISAGLAAFQTFMNYQGESEKHKSAADDYGSMFRIFDTMLMIPGSVRGDPISTLQNLRNQYDDLVRRSPTLPKKYDAELTYEVIQTKKVRAPRPDQIFVDMCESGEGIDDIKKMMADSTDDCQDDQVKTENLKPIHTTLADLNQIFEEENDYDTSDDEHEVCIGFDLDSADCYNTTTAALAVAQLATRRDMQIQASLQCALDFELQRLQGHSLVTPNARHRKRKGGENSTPSQSKEAGLSKENPDDESKEIVVADETPRDN